ncbi:MAG: chemotaxis protein CheR [Spirochaetaceae bacterium]|nr:chemotaxis protein CheR [Spirochaetaceae bacterium]
MNPASDAPGEGRGIPGIQGPSSLSAADFARLAKFIESELGIRMPETKRIMLESRLQKRIRHFGMSGFTEYVDFVFSPKGRESELINMIDAVTTNKTDFFREADHFDYLLESILPELSGRGGSAAFWSAGCSTGEEPYTLAMVLEEYRDAADPRFNYRILASDLSTQVLDKAKAAVYDEEKAAPIPMSYKKKYLLRSKDHGQGLVRIKPELRAKVGFARINFMDERYPVEGLFDVVFCRNVIIYFERPVQEMILGRLCRHVRKDGWLILGHSETLTGMDLPLRVVAPTIYKRL